MLRPHPRSGRDLEKFIRYTTSWLRPASEEDSGTFRVWQTVHGPPSHSVPPHLLVKAAEHIDRSAARALRERLFDAYFAQNLDITAPDTMRELWAASGLEPGDFERIEDPALLREVLDQHQQALAHGVGGVPAMQLVGNDAVIVGAHPRDLYRRWIDRTIAAREG